MPAVVGEAEASAKSKLSDAGFKVTVVTEAGSGTLNVTKQNPTAGDKADVGSTVTITLDGPPPTP